uniref:Secreted Beta-GRP-like protein n=1 Tax=Pristhesancus plagipennis TaxID=1955184 RepID=A0A2K8JSD9_PRIPG|nr:secreted Beta-GRP-like protein [Pristhesancus plagipennis]
MFLLFYILPLFITLVSSDDYIEKEILAKYKLEVFQPKGFRISVPHTDGMTLFAVHLNVNKEMFTLEAGQVAVDVVKRKGDRWVYENDSLRIRPGDKLYFWLYVIYDRLGYRTDFQEYTVPGDLPSKEIEKVAPAPASPSTEKTRCQLSDTMVSGKEVCKGDVVFYEEFDSSPGWGLNNKWSSEVELPGRDSEETYFVVLDNSNAIVEKGFLSIKPTLTEEKYGDNFVKAGHLKLKGCTAEIRAYCETTAVSWKLIPPVLTSRISTKHSFSFKYGKIEIRAKLPKGDWIVPEIRLIGKSYIPLSGRITLAKSFGNEYLSSNGVNIGGQLLEQGISVNGRSPKIFPKSSDNLWSDDFHTYQVDWTRDSITFKVDGSEVGRIKNDRKLFSNLIGGTKIYPFDPEFYISLGIHVGGLYDFPDDAVNRGKRKPWTNTDIKNVVDFWKAKDEWYPTWGDHSKLLVDYIKVTAI